MKKTFILTLMLFFSLNISAEDTLRLATTTSTYETGLLDYILPPFEKKHNVKVHIISVGTGKAIKLGENGDVDIILVHARGAEDRFIQEGYGVNRRDVMYNDFLILGPKDDPANIANLSSSKKAFEKIYTVKANFVSRGDNSGTHQKERNLWQMCKLKPEGNWYIEVGQGMSMALRIADEKNAYIMVDRATYLFNKDKIRLKAMVEGDEDLFNYYGVIAVNPLRHAYVKYELAVEFIKWIVSNECQEMIENYKIDGEQLFYINQNRR